VGVGSEQWPSRRFKQHRRNHNSIVYDVNALDITETNNEVWRRFARRRRRCCFVGVGGAEPRRVGSQSFSTRGGCALYDNAM